MKDYGEWKAGQILESGRKALELTDQLIAQPRLLRKDLRRTAIAWAIWTGTSGVSQQWIADALNLKSGPTVCQQVRRFSNLPKSQYPESLRNWIKTLEK
jgi:uncharacterized protein HemY